VEVAKALGGSFKLVTRAPRTVREMTQLPKETQKNGGYKKIKKTNKHAKCCHIFNEINYYRFLYNRPVFFQEIVAGYADCSKDLAKEKTLGFAGAIFLQAGCHPTNSVIALKKDLFR